jgi:hypothetical protein
MQLAISTWPIGRWFGPIAKGIPVTEVAASAIEKKRPERRFSNEFRQIWRFIAMKKISNC